MALLSDRPPSLHADAAGRARGTGRRFTARRSATCMHHGSTAAPAVSVAHQMPDNTPLCSYDMPLLMDSAALRPPTATQARERGTNRVRGKNHMDQHSVLCHTRMQQLCAVGPCRLLMAGCYDDCFLMAGWLTSITGPLMRSAGCCCCCCLCAACVRETMLYTASASSASAKRSMSLKPQHMCRQQQRHGQRTGQHRVHHRAGLQPRRMDMLSW